jgi:ABC-type nitrate/sulfonate/bicarbonate transport system substrate-binding protein
MQDRGRFSTGAGGLAMALAVALTACAGAGTGSMGIGAAPAGAPPTAAPPGPAAKAPASVDPSAPRTKLTFALPGLGASSLIQYVGVDYGYYAQDGFDVELSQMQPPLGPPALMSKQADVFTGVETSIRIGATGVPLKVVGVSKKSATFSLIARPGIASVPELRGRTVGVGGRTGASIGGFKRVLQMNGMTIDDLNVLYTDNSNATLQNLVQGITDGAVLGAPQVFEALDQGYPQLIYMADKVTFLSNGLVVSDDMLATRRDDVRTIVAREIALVRLLKANKDIAVETLVRRFGIDPEVAARSYDFEVTALTPDIRVPPEEVEATVREEVEAGRVPAMLPASQLVAFDLIEEAIAQAQ